MPIKTPGLAAFHKHKARATALEIPFLFSFEQWCSWWETNLGPDWLKKRGIKKDQYHMARPGDIGPYSPENVKCVTCSQNISEQHHPACEKGSNAKLTLEQVIEIRSVYVPFSRENSGYALSKKYGVTRAAIARCVRGETWRDERAGWDGRGRQRVRVGAS